MGRNASIALETCDGCEIIESLGYSLKSCRAKTAELSGFGSLQYGQEKDISLHFLSLRAVLAF